jgi:YD repeat-containing protein
MSGYGRRYVLEESESMCGTPGVLNFTFEKLGDGRFKQVFEGSDRFSIYSEHGLLLQEYSDKNGSSVYYEYDDQELLIRQFDSYGFSFDFIYNEQGFVSEVIDQASRTWSYSYDEYGRLTQVVDPDGNSRDYGYGRTATPSPPVLIIRAASSSKKELLKVWRPPVSSNTIMVVI